MVVEISEKGTKAPVGTVTLRHGKLSEDVSEAHRERVHEAFETGEIVYALARYGSQWFEYRAQPLTPRWFAAVVVTLLSESYRVNLTEIDDDL